MSAKVFLQRYAKLGMSIDPSVATAPCLRVNTLVCSDDDVLHRLSSRKVVLEKVPFLQDGYWIRSSPFSLGSTTEYLRGMYYLQDAAAQLPVQVLSPQPGERVLDCCASPGGKTTQLAACMKNAGVIVAFEKALHRLASLKANIERCRASNVVLYHADAVHAPSVSLKFDKALVDAPCAGNFASDKGWFDKRSLDDVKHNVETQKRLLRAACDSLRVGGMLVYSTCSLEPEENELIIDWALKSLPLAMLDTGLDIGVKGFTSPFGAKLHEDVSKCRRLWPENNSHEGFFIARMVRKDG